ncbi:MAG: hypothetical protein JXA44_11645 [Methanospirillaceae archaeon]|nr:hypothetical protein [Methanospirillaceae archaeon]
MIGLALSELGRYEEVVIAFDSALENRWNDQWFDEDLRGAREKAVAALEEHEVAYEQEEHEAAAEAQPKPALESDGFPQPPPDGCNDFGCDCSNYATKCQNLYYYVYPADVTRTLVQKQGSAADKKYRHSCCSGFETDPHFDNPDEEEEPAVSPDKKTSIGYTDYTGPCVNLDGDWVDCNTGEIKPDDR